jgi:signal transduction histidine kinase/ligand-binding sensor domain-containing protein
LPSRSQITRLQAVAMFVMRRMRFALFWWLFAAANVSLWAGPWFHRDWQADDGLPGDNVTGVAQTSDGYLWIATQTGLARFDGLRFENVRIPLGREHPIIRAMLSDDSGRLWLAEEGGIIVRMLGGPPLLIPPTKGLSKAQPLELAQGADGAIWVANVDGTVCRIDGVKVRRFGSEDGLPAAGACCLSRDANKRLWWAKAGKAGFFDGTRFVTRFEQADRTIHLQARSQGGMWICAGDRFLWLGEDGKTHDMATIPPDTTVVRPTTLFEDRAGAVWLGTTAGGLFRCDGTNVSRVETSHRRIRTVSEDREGNIWVGTDGGGLNRLRRQVVEIEGKDAGLPFETVRSVCEDTNGTIWVITQNGDVVNDADGSWRTVSSEREWSGGQATCVTCDRQGMVWIGTFSHGLHRFASGNFTPVRRPEGLAQPSIRSLFTDSRGDLWIAFSQGDVLQRYTAGKFQNFDLPHDSRPIRAFTEDALGTVWMANLDMRLLRVDGNKIVDETDKTAEPLHPIRCLTATADGSLWIGYSSSGLGRLKNGSFVKLGLEQGLKDESICSLMPDNNGCMWFGSDHGIFRASLSEMEAVKRGVAAAIRCIGYGRDEGLPSLQGYYGYAPGACRTRDGRILLPTHSGLAIVYPSRVRTNSVPPPVIIEQVELDGKPMAAQARSKALQAPPGHRKIAFTFTAPSFIEPDKVRFRYRLEGWDEDWMDADGARTVAYSRLPAGDYRFRVLAGNSDGVWNETGAQFRFSVAPFLWNTWLFRMVSSVCLLGVVFAAVRFVAVRRLKAKVQRLERENAVQHERARIAADIHDDLGARMTQISLLTERARQSITQPQVATEHVQEIASLSRSGIKSLDEIVWAVNPRNDNVADVLDYAGQYAVDFLRAAGVRCRIDFPDVPPTRELSGEVRHTLFMAIKETLNNVVKHAAASEVIVKATTDGAAFCWEIADNGRGFEHAPKSAFADGVRNLEKRLGAIGGECHIASGNGKGTMVAFRVPWTLKRGI